MKKALLRLFVCVFTLVSLVSFAAGCKDRDPEPEPPEPGRQDVVLYDFEQWGPDFQLCRISANFGRISVNTDSAYVKTGKQSCRVDTINATGAVRSTMYFPTWSDLFDYDYMDFTYNDCVRIDMYNPQSEVKTVNIGLVTNVNAVNNFDRANEEVFSLAPGWNTVNLFVDGPLISIAADITGIQGIYFTFDAAASLTVTDTTPRYYIDRIQLIRKETANETGFGLEFTGNEIIDFERHYQKYFIINDFAATLEIVKASDFGIDATSGTKVLRLVMPGNNTGSWNYYVKIPAAYIKASPLGTLTEEQRAKAYFCYESYNNTSSSINACALFFVENTGSYFAFDGYAAAGKWTQHRIKITDIDAKLSGWASAPGQFAFSIKDVGSVDREFFFDNFRIEFEA